MGLFKKKSDSKVTCRCGHKFKVDWNKFPEDVKITYCNVEVN